MDNELNLNLGLPLRVEGWEFKALLAIGTFISLVFEYTIEVPLFWFLSSLPAWFRAWCFGAFWKPYLSLHRAFLGNRTGIHPSLSYEYHAYTTLTWATRLTPMTLSRMRFGLSQLDVFYPPSRQIRMERVNERGGKVRGIYVRTPGAEELDDKDRKVIFWIFGGAFMAGCVKGNLGIAEQFAKDAGCDVFLVDYGLAPEHNIWDASEDVRQGYDWLVSESGKVSSGKQVSIVGISSGGGLAVRLCQELAKKKAKRDKKFGAASLVLISPWVHYDWENLFDSMKQNTHHEIIVTQAVSDYITPMAEVVAGGAKFRTKVSPLAYSMEGLPTTFLLSSMHEVTWDEDKALHEKCVKANVDVTFHTVKYLSHLFCFLPFIPESADCMDAMAKFVKQKFQKQ